MFLAALNTKQVEVAYTQTHKCRLDNIEKRTNDEQAEVKNTQIF